MPINAENFYEAGQSLSGFFDERLQPDLHLLFALIPVDCLRMPMWDHYPEQIKTTPARCVDGEALVITPHNSTMHNLNETGTFIWEQSNGTQTLAEIVALLSAEYGDDEGGEVDFQMLRSDAEAFVADAEKKGILRVLETPAS